MRELSILFCIALAFILTFFSFLGSCCRYRDCHLLHSSISSGATNQGDPNPCRGQDYMVVKIVDYCPSGCQGTIDLSQEALAAIANPDAGKIEILLPLL
ncbi:hypothetical protein GOBAR_DD24387 [Gossypium barbadense]|nr:hypothetical protein GOBAR_DD24387 [Gossypium barbadense]